MFVFKVFVTTLLLIVIALMTYSSVAIPNKGKMVGLMLVIINALSIIAIWG